MVISARARRYVGDLRSAVAPERLRDALGAVTPSPRPASSAAGRHTTPPVATLQGPYPYGHDVILAAVEDARRDGGPIAAAQALALAHHRLLHPGLGELRHLIAEDLIAEGARTLRHSDTLTGLLWHSVDFVLDGDARAVRCLTELRCLLAVEDHPEVSFVLQAIDVMLEIRAGRFEHAERLAQGCADAGAEAGDIDSDAWHASHLIAIRWYQGRVAELLPLIRRVVAAPGLSPADYSYQSALAVAAAAAGSRAEAREALAALCDRGLRQMPYSGSWLVTLYGVAEAAYLLGERETARQAYELLLPYAALPAMAGPAITCFGSVEHALGIAQLALGRHETAIEHLSRAIAHNAALGHFPAATLARHRLATALADQRHAEIARRDAAELGMTLPAPPPAHRADNATAALTCRRHGRSWQVHAHGRTVEVEHCRGLNYLAVLLANPGREIPALDLAAGPDAAEPSLVMDASTGSVSGSPVRPGLDDGAVVEYRHRLKALLDEIEHCDVVGDQEGAVRAYAERDAVLARLREAAGLDESRPPGVLSEERARIAVGKAIRRALVRIAEADAGVGAAVSAAVRTGRRCVFLPLHS